MKIQMVLVLMLLGVSFSSQAQLQLSQKMGMDFVEFLRTDFLPGIYCDPTGDEEQDIAKTDFCASILLHENSLLAKKHWGVGFVIDQDLSTADEETYRKKYTPTAETGDGMCDFFIIVKKADGPFAEKGLFEVYCD